MKIKIVGFRELTNRITAKILMACLVLSVPAASGCTDALNPDFSRTPVVFVHGHGMSPDDWRKMIRHLLRSGYPREYLFAVDIRPNVMGNVEAAETVIAPAVERLLANARLAAMEAGYSGPLAERVDLVSHSMGAVSSRWYTARIKPAHVRVWISIGGANHGTNVLCTFADAGAADLCPAYASIREENPVQVLLNGTPANLIDETPWGIGPDPIDVRRVSPDSNRRIAYFTIRLENDLWIVPADSAMVAGGGGGQAIQIDDQNISVTSPGNLLLLTDAIHDDMLWEDHILFVVENLLQQDYIVE